MNGPDSHISTPSKTGKSSSACGSKPTGIRKLLSELKSGMVKRVEKKKTKPKPASKKKKPPAKKVKKKITPKKASKPTAKKKKPAARKSATAKKATKKPTKKPTGKKIVKKKTKTTGKKPATKKTKAARKPKATKVSKDLGIKRRPRLYTVRSRLNTFIIGDEVIFKHVRDWTDSSRMVEMRGKVIAIGSDPDNDVNYIEVVFETQSLSGKTNRQVRRFSVK